MEGSPGLDMDLVVIEKKFKNEREGWETGGRNGPNNVCTYE
jgi:hypothetical protein